MEEEPDHPHEVAESFALSIGHELVGELLDEVHPQRDERGVPDLRHVIILFQREGSRDMSANPMNSPRKGVWVAKL